MFRYQFEQKDSDCRCPFSFQFSDSLISPPVPILIPALFSLFPIHFHFQHKATASFFQAISEMKLIEDGIFTGRYGGGHEMIVNLQFSEMRAIFTTKGADLYRNLLEKPLHF